MKIDKAAQEKIDELRAERDYWIDLCVALQEEIWEKDTQAQAMVAQIEYLRRGMNVDLKVV